MGEVIGKNDAVSDILGDLDATLGNAAERGEPWASSAEARLRPIVTLAAQVVSDIKTASEAVTKLRRTRDVRDSEADDLVASIYDELYNDVGRPGASMDPIFDLLFPGGGSAYSAGSVSEQPTRMNMLAGFLEKGLHPRIPAAKGAAHATRLRESAARLREAVHALSGPATELDMLNAMLAVLARTGQVQLARLKRQWKGDGYSEVEIHEVIPDRPRPRKPKGGGSGTPTDEIDDGTAV